MTRRITVIPPQATEERPPFDSWLPGQGLLQETVALAVMVFVAGELILLGAAYLVMPLADAALFTLGAAPVVVALAALTALALAVYRVLRFERRERRHIALLDAQVEEAWRRLEAEKAANRSAIYAGGAVRDDRHWNRLAYEILRRYYDTLARTGSREAAARAISREACVKAELCNQKEWNVVNRLLIKRGIRAGRKRYLQPPTFEAAWRIWQEKGAHSSGWIVDPQGDWIPKE